MIPISSQSHHIGNDQFLLQRLPVEKFSSKLNAADWLCEDLSLLHEPGGALIQLNYSQEQPFAAIVVAKAHDSQYRKRASAFQETLENPLYLGPIWINASAIIRFALPAILHTALHYAKNNAYQSLVTLVPVPNIKAPIATLLDLQTLPDCQQPLESLTGQHIAMAQSVETALAHLYKTTIQLKTDFLF